MSEIDLSQISLDPNFQFSIMKLAEKIVIGSTNHRTSWNLSPGNTGYLTNMNLGELPFLKHLDVRTTEVTTINASKCPDLKQSLPPAPTSRQLLLLRLRHFQHWSFLLQ